MALLQISEPGQTAAPHQHRLAVGIDLGTTNSLVASVRSGIAETLADSNGDHMLPSVVRYAGGKVVVGEAALLAAAEDPLNTIMSVKRMMGRGYDDIVNSEGRVHYDLEKSESGMPRIKTSLGPRSAVEVSADILRQLRDRAEQTLGGDLVGAVITVPAYFDDAQRQATKDAAKLAGLKVLRLLNEPTAAAVAYGLDKKPEGVFAIYDLGGGTFDISVLRLTRGVFEVLATAGDSALGGDDMDHAIAHWIIEQAGANWDSLSRADIRKLLQLGRSTKEALTSANDCDIEIDLGASGKWRGSLARKDFNGLIDPLIDSTLGPCRRALRDAGITSEDIEGVVLVGGSTRVPRVREKVAEFFKQPPLADIDPDKVVAVGAALQADVLAGNKPDQDMLLLDVIPLSLGLEIMGGMTEKVIPRNSTLPIARAQEFTTFKDGQTAMSIHVVQGEREMIDNCRSLARFELRDIPPMAAGAARIRVVFQVDADGLLSVTASEETSGVEAHVEVKPSYGLTDTEIETMLRDSIQHAGEDMEARALREQQVEAKRVIEAVTQALIADGEALLSSDERRQIDEKMGLLEATSQSTDRDAIKQAISSLDEVTQEFAARRMNQGIRKALAGHNINEFGDPSGKKEDA